MHTRETTKTVIHQDSVKAYSFWLKIMYTGQVDGPFYRHRYALMCVARRSNDDRSSEASSVRSSASGNDSSPASSPCDSPQPPTASKWAEGDAGTAAASRQCRYFVVKAANGKMLQTAEQRGFWGTTAGNEKKIAAAFAVCQPLKQFLCFSY